MKSKDHIDVYIDKDKVGSLAMLKDYRIAFEYSDEWIVKGFSISPLSLPLTKKVFIPKGCEPFEGLFGVFSDSLPDGWGRLLTDRILKKRGIDPASTDTIQRLSIIGDDGLGAICYRPTENYFITAKGDISFDELARECKRVLNGDDSDDVDELFKKGGSSGGARPKINYSIDDKEYIVKFPSLIDDENIGLQEYEYMLCAKECGIEVPEFKLIQSKMCSGYFASKRFDREDGKRIHMVSVSGLLETSHRLPNLDYDTLMKLTLVLTSDYSQLEEMFRRMCFNVFAHNRDDHPKNFAFLFKNGKWRLSPAYDLTYSNSIGGEHATTVNGNGKDPGMDDIMSIAKRYKLDSKKAKITALEIKDRCTDLKRRFKLQ